MCDTFGVSSKMTIDGSVIFGKNTDRQPNEPHHIMHVKSHDTDSEEVKCTYIPVPQVDKVNEVLLAKPIWIWGAEMGANEFGVAIGNEAVWTTEQTNDDALIGMDLLRLGLERAKTAEQALNVIATLLETHGQGGNCGFAKPEYYDNSFIISDPKEAWVLETAGRFWIAEKIETIRSISNCLTIENKYDKIHPELLNYAIEKGKCKSEADFNFAKQFSSKYSILRIGAKGDDRRACTLKILDKMSGKITPRTAMTALRSHNSKETYQKFNPRKSSMKSPCLHASSIFTPTQTTGSMVSHLKEKYSIHWLTGSSSPCTSLFKPMVITNNKYDLPEPPKIYNKSADETLWWLSEKLYRNTLKNYGKLYSLYHDELKQIEDKIFDDVYEKDFSNKMEKEELFDYSIEVFNRNMETIKKWNELLLESRKSSILDKKLSSSILNKRFSSYRKKLNKKAGIQNILL